MNLVNIKNSQIKLRTSLKKGTGCFFPNVRDCFVPHNEPKGKIENAQASVFLSQAGLSLSNERGGGGIMRCPAPCLWVEFNL
jgi:hypothetical protein